MSIASSRFTGCNRLYVHVEDVLSSGDHTLKSGDFPNSIMKITQTCVDCGIYRKRL